MSLHGKAAIAGIGETPHKRSWPGRSQLGLRAQVAAEAIGDAGVPLARSFRRSHLRLENGYDDDDATGWSPQR
jgi:hypothetical protein